MTIEARFCAVPTCGETISPQYLMCFAHWRQVPVALQRLVHAAWRQFNDRGIDFREYKELRQDAIDAVTNHPGKPAEVRDPPTRCLISGCETPGRKLRPVCTAHWDALPQKLRLEILAAIKPEGSPLELHIARAAANAAIKSAQEPRP